ncbi:MAG: PAS domain S-box protein [Croceitalea sp.]|nr:PAS domain S-box protein [Croceitalea sp.]MBT8237774.1 PAS domain S-box protein [Croceitalea sp.]NNC35043.1 PAS domain S-box protein [Croceitalea sp.]NNL08143.1 PAS domain S-box protein [Croceitalea sp.]NNM18818.1 PAS domain S-box protein [Croceitalea sp.]
MKTTLAISHDYLLKQLPNATALINTKFELIGASDIWFEFFSLNKHEVLGKVLFGLFNDDTKEWKKCLKNCFNGETEKGLQSYFLPNEGEKWFEWHNVPWYDERENIIGAIIHIQDVTPRVTNELLYEKLEDLLRQQSEISKVGTWELNVVTNELVWSDMTKKIHDVELDYAPNIDSAIDFYKMGHSRNLIGMLVHNCIDKGEPYCEKLEIVTQKGEEKWVLAAGKPIYKNKKLTRLIGTFQDITEQVDAENAIIENQQLLKAIIDNLPLNVFVKDKESRKVLINKSEYEYLGYKSAEALLGKSDFDLYDENIAQISRDEDLHVMKTKQPILGKETTNVKKDGKSTSFLTSKIPWLNIQGEVQGLIGISVDISNLKQKEAQLQDLINISSIQNKKLVNFAHIVSHNLRSHSANFSMLLDFLVQEEDESERKRILDMLLHASDNLLETLENLNEVVDISTNVNIEKKDVDLNNQILKVEQNLAAFLQKNKAIINKRVPNNLIVQAVPAYIESILLNLINNAVKYRHPDRNPVISLEASKNGSETVFEVSDNGLGIDLNKYGSKLFGMYKTFHNNKDARGIGLYIAKNQIEAMGGSIVAESEVGKGTKFRVHLNDEN